MTFAHPLALLWGLLAVPIVILYLRRIRLRREAVATRMIWEQVFAAERARRAWQRWRRPVSLGVQLLILALIVVAAAEPQIPGPRRLVLIVDNSASMNATDVGPSRLEQAKQAAGRLAGGLRDCDAAAVICAGGAVGVRCTFTNDRAALTKAIESVPATEGTTHVNEAVGLARRMLAEDPKGGILVLTDGCFGGAAELVADDVRMIRVGKRTGNVAVTRLAVRRTMNDPQKCEALVEVSNFSDEAVSCEVELELDGKAAKRESLGLPESGRRQQVFAISAPDAGRLTARLAHADAYLEDNDASAPVPPAGQTRFGDPPDIETLAGEWASAGESDLRAPGDIGSQAAAVPERTPGPAPWVYLAAAGGLLLALEWCLYQRRWIS